MNKKRGAFCAGVLRIGVGMIVASDLVFYNLTRAGVFIELPNHPSWYYLSLVVASLWVMGVYWPWGGGHE